MSFYKAVAVFVRAYAAIAQDLTEAGYSDADAAALQREVEFYGEIRSAIKKHSGEELDIKPYEADMRHLLNTYIQADPAADLGELGEMSLTELIIETGIHDAIAGKAQREGHALEECHRRRDHQQRPQDHHPRASHRPAVLRADVQAARRPHQAEPGRCHRVQRVPAEGRGAGEAAGREADRRGAYPRRCTASGRRR